MSYPEAVVQEYLMQKHVPFLWHGFDGSAPDFTQLMPGYAPTFTLSEYKTVLFVVSPYFSGIPGVIDKVALADALLQVDGWNVVVLFESDVLNGKTAERVEQAVPALRSPAILGPEKPNPFGSVFLIAKRRAAREGSHGARISKAGQNFQEDFRDVPRRKRRVSRGVSAERGDNGRRRSRGRRTARNR